MAMQVRLRRVILVVWVLFSASFSAFAEDAKVDDVLSIKQNGDDLDIKELLDEAVVLINRQKEDVSFVRDAIERLETRMASWTETDLQVLDNVQVLRFYRLLGTAYLHLAESQHDNAKKQSLRRSAELLERGLEWIRLMRDHDPPVKVDKKSQLTFLQRLATVYMALNADCALSRVAQSVIEISALGDVSKLPPKNQLWSAQTVTNCDAATGLKMWQRVLAKKALHRERATDCIHCWSSFMEAQYEVFGAKATRTLFDFLKLGESTPWNHSMQLPPVFDKSLAVAEPEPFPDSMEFDVCRRLENAKNDIVEEFLQFAHLEQSNVTLQGWLESVPRAVGRARPMDFDSKDGKLQLDQPDMWRCLLLRSMHPTEREETGWIEERCETMFPKTCAAIRDAATLQPSRVASQSCLASNGDKFKAWCPSINESQSETQSLPGLVGFYLLSPGARVLPHFGPSNNRLRCQLVVQGQATLTAGGQTLLQKPGSVHALDDSYIHEVVNDEHGGMGSTSSNDTPLVHVVFDVTFFHPTLLERHHEMEINASDMVERSDEL